MWNKKMVRVEVLLLWMVFACVVIVIICHNVVPYPQRDFSPDFDKAVTVSVIVHTVIALDAVIEYTTQKDSQMPFFWPLFVCVHFIPNVLIFFGVVQGGVVPLVQYFQHMCSLLLGEYLLHTLSFLQSVSSRDFGKFFFFLFTACGFACLYNISSTEVLAHHRAVLKAFSTASTLLFHALIAKGFVDLIRASFQSHAAIHFDGTLKTLFFVYLFVLFVAGMLPLIDLISYRDQFIFFPQSFGNIFVLESIMLCLNVALFLARCFQTRLALVNLQCEYQQNRQLTRSVSHEIRTPLNTAFMALELLQGSMKDRAGALTEHPPSLPHTQENAQDWLETVDNIRDACNISLGILNQLLTFDKLNEQKLQLEQQLLPVLPIIESNAKLFKIQALQSGIKFKTAMRDSDRKLLSDLCVFVDEHKINQVLRNFLSNAMKFTPRNGTVFICADFVESAKTQELLMSPMSSKNKHYVREDSERTTSVRKNNNNNNNKNHNSTSPASLSHTFRGCFDSWCRRFTSAAIVPTEGGTISKLNVEGAKLVGKIVISIIDSGPGVSPEDQAKLFQEYVQINPGELQKGQGSGLGLSISKAIVALHGGRVGMTSEGKNKGSTFYVELPAYELNAQHGTSFLTEQTMSRDSSDIEMPLPSERDDELMPLRERSGRHTDGSASPSIARCSSFASSSPSSSSGKKRLFPTITFLVVDDAAANRKMLARLLARDGHCVFEASDGAEAVFIMQTLLLKENRELTVNSSRLSEIDLEGVVIPTTPIDVILMDNFMVSMNGPAATQAIRELGFKGPIIGITGSLDDEVDEFLKSGAEIILQKPVDTKAVVQALRSLRRIK